MHFLLLLYIHKTGDKQQFGNGATIIQKLAYLQPLFIFVVNFILKTGSSIAVTDIYRV
jgi:hypothetical protein